MNSIFFPFLIDRFFPCLDLGRKERMQSFTHIYGGGQDVEGTEKGER